MCHLFWDGPFGVAFGCEAQFGWEIHDMDLGFGGGVCGHAVRSWRLQLLGLCDAKAIVHKRLRLRGLCSRCAVWEATTSRIVRRQGYCSQEIEMREECLYRRYLL